MGSSWEAGLLPVSRAYGVPVVTVLPPCGVGEQTIITRSARATAPQVIARVQAVPSNHLLDRRASRPKDTGREPGLCQPAAPPLPSRIATLRGRPRAPLWRGAHAGRCRRRRDGSRRAGGGIARRPRPRTMAVSRLPASANRYPRAAYARQVLHRATRCRCSCPSAARNQPSAARRRTYGGAVLAATSRRGHQPSNDAQMPRSSL